MKINLRNLCGLASTKRRQTILNPFAEPIPETKNYGTHPSISLNYGRSAPAWMGGVDWTQHRKRKQQSLLSAPTGSAHRGESQPSRKHPS